MTFDIYKYPRTTTSKPLGSLTFHHGTPIPQLPSECGVAILDYLRDTKTVFLPSLNIVPMDLKVDEHQRSFVGTLPCIGYQAVPADEVSIDYGVVVANPDAKVLVTVGKDAEFESKHPRDDKGEFTTGSNSIEVVSFHDWYEKDFGNWSAALVRINGVTVKAYPSENQRTGATKWKLSGNFPPEICRAAGRALWKARDSRTAPLLKTPPIIEDAKPPASTTHSVERWYDNRSKNWVVQTKDAAGNQVGDATYVGSKDEAIAAEKSHKERVETIGKDREFEEKHPRAEGGKFAEKGAEGKTTQSTEQTGDVKWEFEQALKQANKFKHANDRQNVMAAMLNSRRADALPQVVSEKEIEHHVAQGEMELWRGVAERRYATGFRGGPLHLGTGILGTGVYVALGPEGRTYAQDYTGQGQGALLHMSLPKDAKIADWRDVNREMEEEAKKAGAHKGPAYTKNDWRRVYTDVGLYAAAKGLDALVWPNLGMGLILNRNKVRVSRENLVAKALTMGNAGLSRRVAECMDTDRMTSLVLSPQYQPFVESVMGVTRFQDLPEWCKEELAEAELEITNG